MSKTYNGLTRPVLLFDKEAEKLIPQAGLQPSYGIWESLDEAKTGLEEEFEDISNIPQGYTFCVKNNVGNKPQEWWFTEKGKWETIAPKNTGDYLSNIFKFRVTGNQMLQVSFDGGKTWTDIAPLSSTTGNYITDTRLTKNGKLQISYDNGGTWRTVGEILFDITSTGYFRYSFDGGTTWNKIKIVAAESLGNPDNDGNSGNTGGPLDNLSSENIPTITFKGDNDSESAEYVGQDACNVLVYIATDYSEQLSAIMEGMYPNVPVGSYIIVRSTLFDRTGGMSNETDNTHTYELNQEWTTADVLLNSSQDIWYHYFKISKVDIGKWAGVAWIGRLQKFEDAVRYKVTIGTVSPSEANITITYNGVRHKNLKRGSVVIVDNNATISIEAKADGYKDYNQTIENIVSDTTVDVSLTKETENVEVSFIAADNSDGYFIVSTDGFKTFKTYDTLISPFEFPKGTAIQVYYVSTDPTSYCADICALSYEQWSEYGHSSESEHVWLKKGFDGYKSWSQYILSEDTVFWPAMELVDNPDEDPSADITKTFTFDVWQSKQPTTGPIIGIGDFGILDSSAHIEIDYTIRTRTLNPRTKQFEYEEEPFHVETSREFTITVPNGTVIGHMTARVVGGSIVYREYNSSNVPAYEDANGAFTLTGSGVHPVILYPADWYSFTYYKDPSYAAITLNGTTLADNVEPYLRYGIMAFERGTVLNMHAEARYHQTKDWTETMPENDYHMVIKLEHE